MFNLIMGPTAATQMDVDRVFEYTDLELAGFFMAAKPTGSSRLESLPTLVLPELQAKDPAFAQVGHIEGLSLGAGAKEWRYRFVPNPTDQSACRRAADRQVGGQPDTLGHQAS